MEDDVLVSYVTDEQIKKILLYIDKSFSDTYSSEIQFNNCINFVNYLKKYNFIIGEIEAEKLLDKSVKLNNMFKILDNANILVRVGSFNELSYLFEMYCLKNDVVLSRDADYGLFEKNKGKKDLDLIRVYLEEVGRYQLLDAQSERDLCIKVSMSDEEARKQLVEYNLRLVVSIAKHFRGFGLSFEDLIQCGNEGLMIASVRYDVSKGYRFSTYATWWIKHSIRKGIAECSRTIRIPVHLHECIIKVKQAISHNLLTKGTYPTYQVISDETGYSIDKIKLAFECMELTVSLSTPIGDDEDSTLGDVIPDSHDDFENIDNDDDSLFVSAFIELAHLTEREEDIIKSRNGFYGDIITLEELGKKYNLTRERVRQIEKTALQKMQKVIKRKAIFDSYIAEKRKELKLN